jgi:hypothetical protein
MCRATANVSFVVLLTIAVSCSSPATTRGSEGARSMHDLVFLTRDGCVNTTTMRARLDEALASLGLPTDYQFIDADTLPPTDARAGYGTPTVLYTRSDLFGLPEPPVPHPPPT